MVAEIDSRRVYVGPTALAARLKRIRERVAAGMDVAQAWLNPPVGFIIRRVTPPEGARYCWMRPHVPRGDDARGPLFGQRWEAVRNAWIAWEANDCRPV